MNTWFKKFSFSTGKLKILAVILMVLDHVGIAFFPNHIVFRIIGRSAFPIFVYLVVQGYFLTSNFNRYAFRLFILAIISEVPYDLFMFGKPFSMEGQNVCFSLLLVLLFIRMYDKFESIHYRFCVVLLASVIAYWFKVDYLWLGILYAIVFYFKLKIELSLIRQMLLVTLFSMTYISILYLQPFAVLALLPISIYDYSKKDNSSFVMNLFNRNKKFYYLFYPIQFILLTLIYLLIFN